MFGRKRQDDVLTSKDKSYIDALIRAHGATEAIRRISERPLITREVLQAAKAYVKKG